MTKFHKNIHQILPPNVFLIPVNNEGFQVIMDILINQDTPSPELLNEFGYKMVKVEGKVDLTFFLPMMPSYSHILKVVKIFVGSRNLRKVVRQQGISYISSSGLVVEAKTITLFFKHDPGDLNKLAELFTKWGMRDGLRLSDTSYRLTYNSKHFNPAYLQI
jgi:hypothetical protein